MSSPSAGIGSNPPQHLFGRRCKTLLPVAGSLLQPSYPTEEDTLKIIGAKLHQQYYYNRQSKPLEPIAEGDSMRMKLPGQDTWSPGVCTGQKRSKKSYHITADRGMYRCNRRQLIKTAEPHVGDPVPVEVPSGYDDQQPSEPSLPPQNMQSAQRLRRKKSSHRSGTKTTY